MISLKKLIYSVPDALEILFQETGKRMEFQDLFPFARDGLLYLSILEDEESIAKSLRLHWENTITKSGAHDPLTKSEDFVASMLSKAERQPSGKFIAYIPPCNGIYLDHELYLQNGASCTALPINEIMLEPHPDASIIIYDYGIECNKKKTVFYGVCDHRDHDGLEELLTLGCFNENIETHLEKLLYITKSQLESFWLHLSDVVEEEKKEQHLPEPISENWGEVTVKLFANYRIAIESGDTRLEKNVFEIGLVNKTQHTLNKQGIVLLGLAQKLNFPRQEKPTEAEKQVMKKLRRILKDITGLEQDPFLPIDSNRGWKPRFELIDSTNLAGQRAKERATHVDFDDSNRFEYSPENKGVWYYENPTDVWIKAMDRKRRGIKE